MRDEALRLYHLQAVEVWENFCRLHRDLYERTCDEYHALLSGEVEAVEELVSRKELVIADISEWERRRAALIAEMNRASVTVAPITNIKGLLTALAPAEAALPAPALNNLNGLLIDIISRTQEQNRKNQQFLNRALLSLKEIREGFSGKKQYTSYGADGMTRALGR